MTSWCNIYPLYILTEFIIKDDNHQQDSDYYPIYQWNPKHR